MKDLKQTEIEVALLMENLQEAQQLAHIFRKIDIIPCIYQDLQHFWDAMTESHLNLSIVDIRLAAQGNLAIHQHPAVKAKNFPLVFYYDEKHTPLLLSSYQLFHLGTICASLDLEGQVKVILERLNQMNLLRIKIAEKAKEILDLDKKLVQTVKHGEELKEKEYYRERWQSWQKRLDPYKKKGEDFWLSVAESLDVFQEVTGFLALELSPDGRKLLSPSTLTGKFLGRYKDIPPLWPGKVCDHGIEFFVQNTAAQVSLDLMGGDQVPLLIWGRMPHPEKMLFIQTNDLEFLQKFDWKGMERELSGFYCLFELKYSNRFAPGKHPIASCHPWELFSLLDQFSSQEIQDTPPEKQADDSFVLIDLDFSRLITLVRKKTPVRFYWEQFFTNFFSLFLTEETTSIKLTCMGIEHVGLLLEKEQSEWVFEELKTYTKRYPYWRYFEDTEILLTKDVSPEIKMIPLSPEGYMKALKNMMPENVQETHKRPQEAFYSHAKVQEV